LFCSIRHPLIIAPIAAQRQALLPERLRFIDLEQKTLQPLDNPFGTGLSPMS
jgi:hypothetical protein